MDSKEHIKWFRIEQVFLRLMVYRDLHLGYLFTALTQTHIDGKKFAWVKWVPKVQ